MISVVEIIASFFILLKVIFKPHLFFELANFKVEFSINLFYLFLIINNLGIEGLRILEFVIP